MITKCLKFSCSLLLILTCAGCLKTPIQRPRNLKPLTKETAHDSQTKEQVTVYAKKLSFEDQELMFGNCAKQLEKYHIVPVQITLENNSAACWVLTDKNIALNKLTIDEVNAKLFASRRWIPLWIFLGGVACTAIVAPLIGIAVSSAFLSTPVPGMWISDMGMGGVLGWGLLGITAGPCAAIVTGGFLLATTSCISVVDGIVNHMSKKQMREYLKTCCNAEGITINTDITASMLFFVEESQLPEKLNLLLTDKNVEKNTLQFELNL